MSGDLISRSELIKEMRKLHPNWHLETMGHLVKAGIEECVEIAKSQPTAYNVDKVVEKLDEYQRAFPTDSKDDYFRGVGVGAKSCIEIVKAGGVE